MLKAIPVVVVTLVFVLQEASFAVLLSTFQYHVVGVAVRRLRRSSSLASFDCLACRRTPADLARLATNRASSTN